MAVNCIAKNIVYSDTNGEGRESIAPISTEMPKTRNVFPKQPQQVQALKIRARSRQRDDFKGILTPSQPNINQNGTVPAVKSSLFPKLPQKLLPIYERGNEPKIPQQPNMDNHPKFSSDEFFANFKTRENVMLSKSNSNKECDETLDETDSQDKDSVSKLVNIDKKKFFSKKKKRVIAVTIIAAIAALIILLALLLKTDIEIPGVSMAFILPIIYKYIIIRFFLCLNETSTIQSKNVIFKNFTYIFQNFCKLKVYLNKFLHLLYGIIDPQYFL